MKRIILICASVLALASCAVESDPQPNETPTVVQDWALVSKTTTVAIPTATPVASTVPFAAGCRVVYRADGSWQSAGPGIPTQQGTYTVAGNTITMMLGGRAHTLTVAELTATRMQTREVSEEPGYRAEKVITYTR